MNLFESLSDAIRVHFPELDEVDLQFAEPPKSDVGDLALRTFIAAKKLGMSPPEFAGRIAEDVAFGPEVASAEAAGPYVNFRVNRAPFARRIVQEIFERGAQFGANDSGTGKRLLLEHTSINPNASPHVGRARNAMYGDTLARLFAFEGFDVNVHYYVNDIGRQIGLLVLHCGERLHEMAFDDILDAYVEANSRAENDPVFAEQGYALLAKMEAGDEETERQFHAVTDLCLKGQVAVLERLGIHYDTFDRESKYLNDPALDRIVDALKTRDAVFTDEDDRLVVDLSKIGHERDEGRYFVLRRGNGSSMYGFRDIAYNIDKASQDSDLNIQVFGEDHKLYAEQLALILDAAGESAPETAYYAYVLLKAGKMSTRQGKVVLLSDFLDEAARLALERVREQCAELSGDEQESIAKEVAIAAIRFAILRVNPNKNVIFDWNASLSFSGDTGPYVQYSCARINSILRKFGEVPTETVEPFSAETDAEWTLLTKLASFEDVVAAAAKQRNGAPVARFALETAAAFTTFYHDCPVLNAESEALKTARAQICAATLQTLTNALHILGIKALERM